jgi:GT2 family glycosyltransferase
MGNLGVRKKLVVVLGMHRSGTSVLSRALRVLGVSLGDNLLPPAEDNQKGFWEDADVNALNVEMLKAIDSEWSSLGRVSEQEVELLVSLGYLERALDLLEGKLSTTDIYGVKDPRMAKLLPFWQRVFGKVEADVCFVVAIRNPLSVAKSLYSRNQIRMSMGYLLWLEHVIESLVGTRDLPSVLVNYDCLLQDPERELEKVSKELGLQLDKGELTDFAEDFLDVGLRHTQFNTSDLEKDDQCVSLVAEVYSVLDRFSIDGDSLSSQKLNSHITQWGLEWDRLSGEFKRIEATLVRDIDNLLIEKQELEKQLEDLTCRVQSTQFDLAASEHQRELMFQSFSWRITKPVRATSNALRSVYRQIPMPNAVRKLVRGAVLKVTRPKVNVFSGAFVPRDVFLTPQGNEPDYIVWGVIDWHFRMQRPQQIALSLKEQGRRVFYISSQIIHSEQAGFEIEPLDGSGMLFQIKLYASGAPVIYDGVPCENSITQLRQSVGEVLEWAASTQIVSIVDHPFWYDIASVLPNNSLVFDCMDHHEGFGNNSKDLVAIEKQLIQESELTITTSGWLDERVGGEASRTALIRNAGDYEYFSKEPDEKYKDPQGRKVLGYYGAIAEWFDIELIEKVALAFPECSVLLIGADTANVHKKLVNIPNVTFIGEVPYQELPFYLYGIDVCLLPFRVIPLTLATNPVKAYEYLSAKKPVVTVDLPEMHQFEGLMYIAENHDVFVDSISDALNESGDELRQRRDAFAKKQTWLQRTDDLVSAVEDHSLDPKVSVVVVTYNNLDLTKACLKSLDELSQYSNLEIIVVDNDSKDDSPTYLSEWVIQDQANRKLILNDDNKGFAAANNQGLEIADGEYLALLNNDTHVTPGWIRTLVGHLKRDPSIGLIGPVTNNIGNEAKISIAYDNMEEMLSQSSAYTRRHIGQVYPLRTAAFFCVMMQRSVYQKVGNLDEVFGRGFFEDDDYCRRIETLGLRVVCAEDVFIHHQLSASFDKLKHEERQKLFEENKKIYEEKWGEWLPHSYR